MNSRKRQISAAFRAAGIGRVYWRSSYPRWRWDTGVIARVHYFDYSAVMHCTSIEAMEAIAGIPAPRNEVLK